MNLKWARLLTVFDQQICWNSLQVIQSMESWKMSFIFSWLVYMCITYGKAHVKVLGIKIWCYLWKNVTCMYIICCSIPATNPLWIWMRFINNISVICSWSETLTWQSVLLYSLMYSFVVKVPCCICLNYSGWFCYINFLLSFSLEIDLRYVVNKYLNIWPTWINNLSKFGENNRSHPE